MCYSGGPMTDAARNQSPLACAAQQFRDDGYVVVPGLLPAAVESVARAAQRRMRAGFVDLIRTLRHGRFEVFPPRRAYAVPAIHRMLKRRFDYPNGFFVEAGANDGLNINNSAYLERYQGWTGLLIEPLPDQAARCREVRAAPTIEAALVSDAYQEPTVHLLCADLMSTIVVDGVDAARHVQKAHGWMKRRDQGKRLSVPARTLTSILRAANVSRIDLLILDVEQAEFDALGGLDFTAFRPRNMLIETRDFGRLAAFLGPRGYVCEERVTAQDFLFRAR